MSSDTDVDDETFRVSDSRRTADNASERTRSFFDSRLGGDSRKRPAISVQATHNNGNRNSPGDNTTSPTTLRASGPTKRRRLVRKGPREDETADLESLSSTSTTASGSSSHDITPAVTPPRSRASSSSGAPKPAGTVTPIRHKTSIVLVPESSPRDATTPARRTDDGVQVVKESPDVRGTTGTGKRSITPKLNPVGASFAGVKKAKPINFAAAGVKEEVALDVKQSVKDMVRGMQYQPARRGTARTGADASNAKTVTPEIKTKSGGVRTPPVDSKRREFLFPWVASLENGGGADSDSSTGSTKRQREGTPKVNGGRYDVKKDGMDESMAKLLDMFPDNSAEEIRAALVAADGDVEGAAQALLGAGSAGTEVIDVDADEGNGPAPRKRRLVKKQPRADSEDRRGTSDDVQIVSVQRPPIVISSPPSSSRSSPTPDAAYAESESSSESSTVTFFNTCTIQQLMDATGCSLDQANFVSGLRPFTSYDHLTTSLSSFKKQKGLAKLVEKYEEVVEGYETVDQIIQQCTTVGDDIMNVLKGWTAHVEKGPVAAGGEGNGEEDEGPVLALTQVDESVLSDDGTDVDEDVSEKVFKCLKKQPPTVNPKLTLKSYQLVGVSWMHMLYEKGLGGILADEMGLGKTAQVISFLALLKQHHHPGPHMIVVPSSTLDNWLREFEKWCPSLQVESYYGSQKERNEKMEELYEKDFDVLVTTYTLATGQSQDRKFLRRMNCQSLILDEGHMVKNMESARYKYLMAFKPKFRLLLTGTPLQNNLMELLALLTFIMPSLFIDDDSKSSINRIFNIKNSGNQGTDAGLLSRQRIQRARKIMTPFVLRRKKAQVLTELPQKFQRVELCTMTDTQKAVYQSIVAESRKTYMESAQSASQATVGTATSGTAKRGKAPAKPKKAAKQPDPDGKKQVQNVLMQLRKAADHPLLFRRIYSDDKLKIMARDIMKEPEYCDANRDLIIEDMEVMSDFELHLLCRKFPKTMRRHELTEKHWMDAGKVRKLEEILPGMRKKGDRILIFSQFVMVLDILECVMNTLGMRYSRMDGRTSVLERQQMIDEYNETDEITVFLLSTKAGGFGINLTSANVVIIYDLDFNPHNDAQAEDRAHRVGQTRDVTVLKLVSDSTIEQHILKLASAKLKLDEKIQEGDEDEETAGGGERSKQLMDMLRSEWLEGNDGVNGKEG